VSAKILAHPKNQHTTSENTSIDIIPTELRAFLIQIIMDPCELFFASFFTLFLSLCSRSCYSDSFDPIDSIPLLFSLNAGTYLLISIATYTLSSTSSLSTQLIERPRRNIIWCHSEDCMVEIENGVPPPIWNVNSLTRILRKFKLFKYFISSSRTTL
jgi:hypothetical protein